MRGSLPGGNSLCTAMIAGLLLSAAGLFVNFSLADDGQKATPEKEGAEAKPEAKPKPEVKPGKAFPKVDADHEKLALAFATEHHAELATLLTQLKQNNRREYAKAVQELYQSRERLVRIKERQPDLYNHEIELWKLTSRIRLLSARMTMTDDPALEEDLGKLLKTRGELQVKHLQAERDRVATRLARVERDLAEAEARLDDGLDKEVAAVKSQVAKEKSKVKKSGKVVNKTPPKSVQKESPSAAAVKQVPRKSPDKQVPDKPLQNK